MLLNLITREEFGDTIVLASIDTRIFGVFQLRFFLHMHLLAVNLNWSLTTSQKHIEYEKELLHVSVFVSFCNKIRCMPIIKRLIMRDYHVHREV